MNIQEWINRVAYPVTEENSFTGEPCVIYLSRTDNSYVGMEGQLEDKEFFAEHGIEQLQTNGDPGQRHAANTGFSPAEQKWYGWSHRAIFGFGIGHTVKKGDCNYIADNPEELIDDHANFFADISPESADRHRAECQILPDRSGIRILPAPLKIPVAESLDELEAAMDGSIDLPETDIAGDYRIEKCGRGEWSAKTLDDCKQMAIDFAESVS